MKNKIRLILQSIFMALIGYVAIRPLFDPGYLSDFEAYCPFGGLESLSSKINQGTMSCNMSETQVILGIGLIIAVVLVGKLFCGYVCPIGTVSEWLGKLGDKLHIRRDIPAKLDRPLRILKYVLLFLTLYFTMTSGELFSRQFDPYYALVNGFNNSDIVLYFALPAFLITIFGALFFRMFWCRYLCPLGALSNIFMNVIAAGAAIILYTVLIMLGVHISLVWLVAVLVIIGIVTELGFMRSFFNPLPKITRNLETCSNCNFCDDKCPQGIKISQFDKVNHIDCTLCTDCVYSCPLKNTLTVHKKKNLKYLSPIVVVVVILLSLGAASKFEFTTIAEKWGTPEPGHKLAMYEQTGLKTVKCYGSSMALKSTLDRVDGIYGLDTYAKSHTVKIYYDPEVISENKVKQTLFTPIKQEVRRLKPGMLDSLAVWQANVYGLFDLLDFNNLFYTLREDEGVYGFETSYGEPVITSIYYDPQKTNPEKLKAQIEKKYITVKKPKSTEEIELSFKVEDKGINKGYISIAEYIPKIFRIYDRVFNNYKSYGKGKLSVLVFPMPEAAVAPLRRYLGSMASHLSADDGIVRLSTRYTDMPTGFVYFDPSKTTADKIKTALTKQKLTIFLNDTETKEMDNPFHIKPNGKVESAMNINID